MRFFFSFRPEFYTKYRCILVQWRVVGQKSETCFCLFLTLRALSTVGNGCNAYEGNEEFTKSWNERKEKEQKERAWSYRAWLEIVYLNSSQSFTLTKQQSVFTVRHVTSLCRQFFTLFVTVCGYDTCVLNIPWNISFVQYLYLRSLYFFSSRLPLCATYLLKDCEFCGEILIVAHEESKVCFPCTDI